MANIRQFLTYRNDNFMFQANTNQEIITLLKKKWFSDIVHSSYGELQQ